MRPNTVRETWGRGGTAINAWLAIPSGYSAEVVGNSGFDVVTVDMQHGMIGFDAALAMFQAISATPAVPFARVQRNDPALIMHLLDAGAYGLICPMVSTAEQAAAFASACRYPPAGVRSFGPARGMLYGGPDYFQKADDEIVALAMIETAEGLENLEAIVATPGLDGIYVGPNDLCLALGVAPNAESPEPVVTRALARIVEACRKAGKVAGIFCSGGEAAARRAEEGFALVTPGNDANLLGKAAREAVAAARSQTPIRRSGTGY
jgi:4-hydroxy-2-oxoheptanedioate aldolase